MTVIETQCKSCKYKQLEEREKELKLNSLDAERLLESHKFFMKMAAGRLKWKTEENQRKGIHNSRPPQLQNKDIKELHIMRGFIERFLTETKIDRNISQNHLNECFFNYHEAEVLTYFEHNLEKQCFKDSFGISIQIPENSYAFMYKDKSGKHNVAPQNYIQERGQRLPYIRHVITQSKCLFERPWEANRNKFFDRMYLHSFLENNEKIYFCVITLRKHNAPCGIFKTAFPFIEENNLARRISGYNQVGK